MDPVNNMDNPAPATGEKPVETPALENIMGNMTGEKKPEAEPGNANAGEKAEGSTDNGQELPAWTEQLPAELKTADFLKTFSKFKKVGDLAKSYSELEKKNGKSIAIPGDDASEEEKAAFYEKLGRLKNADEYKVPDEKLEYFKALAYENNLSQQQLDNIMKAVAQNGLKMLENNAEMQKRQAAATDAQLRKEYGSAYPEKIELLQRGIRDYGGNELGAKLQQSGLLYDPQIVKMFIALGEQNAEAGSVSKGAGGGRNEYKSTSEGGMFTFKDL